MEDGTKLIITDVMCDSTTGRELYKVDANGKHSVHNYIMSQALDFAAVITSRQKVSD